MSSNVIINFKPKEVVRHLPWRTDSKAALGFVLILTTFSLVGWLYLTQASAVTATSYEINELRLELDQVQNQNAALALEIAQLEALSRVEARAKELGFRPTLDVYYLPVQNYPIPTDNESEFGYDELITQPQEAEEAVWWLQALDGFVAFIE